MSYTFQKITEISYEDFSSIFNDCYSSILAGKGMYLPFNLSIQERKNYVYQQLVSNLSFPQAITIKILDSSSKTIGLMQGAKEAASIFRNKICLLGKDTTNSRKYLYSTDFITSLANFLKSEGYYEVDLYVIPNSRNHTDITSKAYLPNNFIVTEKNYTDSIENNYIRCAIGLVELDLEATSGGLFG